MGFIPVHLDNARHFFIIIYCNSLPRCPIVSNEPYKVQCIFCNTCSSQIIKNKVCTVQTALVVPVYSGEWKNCEMIESLTL